MTPNDLGTCEWLVGELVRARLLERGQLDPLLAEFRETNPYGDATALAEFLTQQQLLTPFQANRALQGDARKLVLGPYMLVDSIGTGNMGTVYKAIGRADRLAYAVKVLPMRSLWNVRLARKQVRAFAELPPHPVVVPFIDVGTALGVHYLVWPCVDGLTLEKLVKERGPLPFTEIARIGLQIAEGLQNCHPRGLFHGLLKPSNVMVGTDQQVRLLDFGIGALLAENIDEEESLIDTISTANATSNMLDCSSPECIVDPTKRTPAGDQYSLGCTLYYATAGRYPFPDGNVVEKMMAHQNLTPPSLRSVRPDTPSGLIGVIERLMSKNADARYPKLSDLIDLLTPLSRGNTSGVIPRSSTMAAVRQQAVAAKPPVGTNPASGSMPAAPAAPANPAAPLRPAAPNAPTPAAGNPAVRPGQPGAATPAIGNPAVRPGQPAAARPAQPTQPTQPRPTAAPGQPAARANPATPPAAPGSPAAPGTPAAPRPATPRSGAVPPSAPTKPGSPLHPASLHPDDVGFGDESALNPPEKPGRRNAGLVDASDDFDSAPLPELTPSQTPLAARGRSNPTASTPPSGTAAPGRSGAIPTAPNRSGAIPTPAPRTSPAGPAAPTAPAMPSPSNPSGMAAAVPAPLMVSLPPPPQLSFGEKLSAALMFWKPAQDFVQVTMFAVPTIRRGEAILVQAIVHPPAMTQKICSYAQSVQMHTQVLGATYFNRRIVRGKGIQLYLEVQGSMIDSALQPLVWNGQPGEIRFQLQLDPRVQAESVAGALSVGQDNVLIGQVPIQFRVG
ncbi:serine/threonine protein kinase [Tuwongella immobilis]|uniref:Protein kinase domain-containing protein n=1 Tax=Tuwongella immobilis TaxID=692036 RepID=A0A6C2YH88_9BACT|nr:serine/threonine-protein kinase [Tuwongella immobilis]VIP00856.1 serine threonine protein kinase with pasta sensor : Serine/threonine protein kinase OS=Planctomyces brasiliensis (strain ATCC 49424 / DSM 5305 / JCM 21570 / NBRC 103401 / IFAM 1448) GN=Plabr_2195 PE=3 SV=1: Pkinase [Tuwongella immobilis]VTR97130.1 serine threonine protein kinase with pasta sensor : Serine/threonine protein kinase OS=Planctomyces brasiliensis (strain ATCC 49424 / DSM 5305 / JCM 21570 / NBRC 103401 / IFAM 1448) GN=